MVKKMTFLAGLGVGYLIGSKAGRERIKSLWNDPKVQDTVSQGTEWAKQKAPEIQEKVTGAAKDAAASAKDAVAQAKDGASSGPDSKDSSGGASSVAGTANPADHSHTSGGGASMDPARPQPESRP